MFTPVPRRLLALTQPTCGLALATALLGATQAWAVEGSAAGAAKAAPIVATSTIDIKHQTVDLPVDFDTFNKKLVSLLGHFDPNDTVIATTDLKRGLERLQASQGEQGLMLFDGSNDHGLLFPLIGQPARKSIRHHLGNPLIAIKMEQKNMGVALYAPLTVLIYEKTPGSVRVEYDLPSTTFGQFRDPDIDKVAAVLDTKLYALLLKSAGMSD